MVQKPIDEGVRPVQEEPKLDVFFRLHDDHFDRLLVFTKFRQVSRRVRRR